jgi:sterol desaturase/sphingolipid hydroxylase (fatty acid hydroxylase superfamily)
MSKEKPLVDRIFPWCPYPLIMATGIGLHYLILHLGFELAVATYIPAIFGAATITFLELRYPQRKEWLANSNDVLNDSIYMVVVQIVLPRILSFALAITLLSYLKTRNMTFEIGWPYSWPVFMQAILMVLSADFLRYWLHRLSHEWPLLWRLHAVHHSPHKLYWVNVARFHPIEKTLQYLFDALPFIVLGIAEEVLALYFVFYSINGFFQHCNIKLRLGYLNYIISGPELHRWHHSMVAKESNQNYGNNLIVWDILFGTRFLPPDRQVDTLGLTNRKYPMPFISQLKTPFIKGIEQE